MLDSPTNNFATWNPLDNDAKASVFAEGNLKGTTSSYYGTGSSFILPASGKWYAEFNPTSLSAANGLFFGIADPAVMFTVTKMYDSPVYCAVYRNDGLLIHYNGTNTSTDIATFVAGDIISIAVDVDADEIWIAKNNVWQGASSPNPSTGTSGHDLTTAAGVSYTVIFGSGDTSAETGIVNFGQDSSFAGNKTAQGNQDANEIGDFYYAPPTDFLALCTSNLPTPEIKLPGDNFNTVLYTGDGATTLAVTGVGFEPSLTWIKNRDEGDSSVVVDDVRGANLYFSSDTDSASVDDSTFVASLDSDGFTVGDDVRVNTNTEGYVSWNWGLATTTFDPSTAGTVASGAETTGKSNSTAGFSIVKYQGEASTMTIGHGLSQAPELIIVKKDNGTQGWPTFFGDDRILWLNEYGESEAAGSSYWNNTNPTASVFSVGNSTQVNDTLYRYMAYCFHSIEGYSKIGTYEGNGNVDGPFIYTGFRPAFFMVKNMDTDSTNWLMMDNKRLAYNEVKYVLYPSNASAESVDSNGLVDFVSNGIKNRCANSSTLNASVTYLYYACAESPFKYANAR